MNDHSLPDRKLLPPRHSRKTWFPQTPANSFGMNGGDDGGICWIESAKKAETRGRRIEWAVQALRRENDAPVGPDALTANSKTVKLDITSADWSWPTTGLRVIPSNKDVSACYRQPRRAASIAAMSIFFIVIIASKARFASPPPAASASVSARGVICQEMPQRSLHQPHWLSVPPLPTIEFQ